MAYPQDLYEADRLYDMLHRKEFAQLYMNRTLLAKLQPVQKGHTNPSFLNELFFRENNLILHPNQQVVRNLMSPETNNTRILVNQGTGAGKTILAIVTAMEYIRLYQQMYNAQNSTATASAEPVRTPSVFIIGFSKSTFLRELLRRPEFGFVTKAELKELHRLREISERGTQADQDALGEFESRLRRRLTKRQRGGFFKFYGYKEFYNRLFNQASLSTGTHLDEDAFLEAIKTGQVQLNLELLDTLRNSLIICDEIHNVYNSAEINNYGVAIRFALNMYDIPDLMAKYASVSPKRLEYYKTGTLRLMLMSATIINNSPTEIIDHLNLLVPSSRIAEFEPQIRGKTRIETPDKTTVPRLLKSDFFVDSRNLKPGALKLIGEMTRGLVSFMRDTNSRYYPERIIEGEEIDIPAELLDTRIQGYTGKTLPYLRFIRCPMSPLHLRTYVAAIKETGTLPPDGQALTDIVLPNPDTGSNLGLFRSKEVKIALSAAPAKWSDKVGVSYVEGDIVGSAFELPHLKEYTGKYYQMVLDLLDNLENDRGKIFISHQQVHMSGVKLIEEVLRRNGMIDENSTPAAETRCSRCGVIMKDHEARKSKLSKPFRKAQGHAFIPARFVTIHGEIDEKVRNRSLDRFRSQENLLGYQYRALIGSRVMNESVDLVACENEWVMHIPDDIPTLLQIFGRVIRKGSHRMMPPERRQVHIRIYVSSLDLPKIERKAIKRESGLKQSTREKGGSLSYEELRYHEKLQDYLVIQEIERVINENALDLPIQYDLIFPPHVESKTRPKGVNSDGRDMAPVLGTLYYKPSKMYERILDFYESPNKIVKASTDTFEPYYSEESLHRTLYLIKRLFAEQSFAYTYEELWARVRSPPFEVQFNAALLDEGIFRVALERLVHGPGRLLPIEGTTVADKLNVSRYLDPDDPYVITRGRDHQIIWSGKLYILVPVQPPVSDDTHPMLGVNQRYSSGSPDTDVDSWYRSEASNTNRPMYFTITKQLRGSYPNYAQLKYKFFQQYRDLPVEQIPTSTEIYDMTFHRQFMEDAISYAFRVLTDEKQALSELHDFYFRMLYIYDRLELILFAEYLRDTPLWETYDKYVSSDDTPIEIPGIPKTVMKEIQEGGKYNAFMMSSVVRNVPGRGKGVDPIFDRLAQFLGPRQVQNTARDRHERMAKFYAIVEKRKKHKIRPVYAHLLPVGHLLDIDHGRAQPRLLDPTSLEFHDHPELSQAYEMPSVENSHYVGYYERTPSSLEVRFKIRPPVQKIEKHKDNRMVETGSSCNTRKKEEHQAIIKNLGLKPDFDVETASIKDMCNYIKVYLMEQDLRDLRRVHHLSQAERVRHPRVRWFYLHFEKQPTPN